MSEQFWNCFSLFSTSIFYFISCRNRIFISSLSQSLILNLLKFTYEIILKIILEKATLHICARTIVKFCVLIAYLQVLDDIDGL